jgi:predicted AAA+ superfamily ATPase
VRGGRSFNPDEFEVALEQVVAGRRSDDYCNPEQFFARTQFTRALKEHMRMALRPLAWVAQHCSELPLQTT